MSSKWDMYDELIDGIPSDIKIQDFCVGTIWTYVKTEVGCGTALTVRQRAGSSLLKGSPLDMNLKDVAALSKSWNFIEATIGMAAVNSWYNRYDHVKAMGALPEVESNETRTQNEVFKILGQDIRGKNVTVVGHFPYIEKQIGPYCNLTILEREPGTGDLPDSACEYIMEDQDFLIITGMTFTNKTLPRLLELARPETFVDLAGPSVAMAECLKKYGVNHLSGFCCTEPDKLKRIITQGTSNKIFGSGYMLECGL